MYEQYFVVTCCKKNNIEDNLPHMINMRFLFLAFWRTINFKLIHIWRTLALYSRMWDFNLLYFTCFFAGISHLKIPQIPLDILTSISSTSHSKNANLISQAHMPRSPFACNWPRHNLWMSQTVSRFQRILNE